MTKRSGGHIGVIGIFCVLMASCASTPYGPFSVTEIYVEPKIPFPSQMYFAGLSQAVTAGLMAGLFGGIGAGSVAAASFRPNNVALDAMVRQEAIAALRAHGLKEAPNGARVPYLRLTLGEYGFAEAGAMSRRVRPLMTIVGQLTGPDGKVLWRGSGFAVNTDGSLPTVLPENLKNNPKVATQYLQPAASKACDRLISNMNKYRQ